MTIIFPTLSRSAPRDIPWSLDSNTQAFVSPFTADEQTVELPGARWKVTLAYDNLSENDAALLQAFLLRMRGKAGRVALHNPARAVPRGIATGVPLVKGGGQFGTQLITDGWTASKTGIMKAGDFFGVNGELKMIVEDADSDASGNATLLFEPPLRSIPADNAVITTVKPTAIFRRVDDSAQWTTAPGRYTSFSMSFVEVP